MKCNYNNLKREKTFKLKYMKTNAYYKRETKKRFTRWTSQHTKDHETNMNPDVWIIRSYHSRRPVFAREVYCSQEKPPTSFMAASSTPLLLSVVFVQLDLCCVRFTWREEVRFVCLLDRYGGLFSRTCSLWHGEGRSPALKRVSPGMVWFGGLFVCVFACCLNVSACVFT